MINPRWKKMIGDLRATRGRMVMMTLAIAVGIFGVSTILSAYTILTREIAVNYKSTNPASAYLEVEHLDSSLVNKVLLQPGIADAEATSWVQSRIEVKPNEWRPLLLFVIEDFNNMRIGTIKREDGAWPPTEGSILLERTALQLLNATIGAKPRIQTETGQKVNIEISGTVHDPSLAPSWQEQTAYGYVTPSTLVQLGDSAPLSILKVMIRDKHLNRQIIERNVGQLAAWLKQQGHPVGEIRIPPPGKHPHQAQMTAVLVMLLLFSFMALLLSGILTATMIGGLLAGQVRQIGIMKALGARTWQIARLYLVLVVMVSIVAVLIGVPLGIVAGQGFATATAGLLNITIYSDAVPAWSYMVLIAVGIFVPLLLTLFPVMRSARLTVREAISDFGVSRKLFGASRLDQLLSRIRMLDRTLILALRNAFRKRGRLLLTISLLAAAGGMFVTSFNIKAGWDRIISDASLRRHYDLEIQLNSPEKQDKLIQLLRSMPEVRQVEAWNRVPAAVNRQDRLDIVRTYPDGGHGSFTLRSAPAQSDMIQLPVMQGRWLQSVDDDNAVVLNHMALALFPEVHIGDMLPLTVDGRAVQLQLVGIVRENMAPAAAYVTPNGYYKTVGISEMTNTVRVVLKEPDTGNEQLQEIEQLLDRENIPVKAVISREMMDEAISGHVYIILFALMLMSIVIGIVGALGLMSTMGTNVVERTREFGIMRTIGGRSRMIMRNVISEGILIGLMSWAIAIVISLPLSAAVGKLIGQLAFRSPLPLLISPTAIVIWLAVIFVGSAAVSFYPAKIASRLTIRDALDHI